MKQEAKEIVFKGDILKKVAQELDMPIDQAEKNYGFMIKALQETLWDPEIAGLKVPFLGTLWFRLGKARKYLKVGTPGKDYFETIKKRVENLEQDRVDRGLEGRRNLHMFPPVTLITNLVGRRNLKEIEEFQNKYYERVTKSKDYSGVVLK